MKKLAIILFFIGFYVPYVSAQLAEDCVDALELVDVPTNLFDIPDITVDSLAGSGSEPAELKNISREDCGPHGYSPQAIDKSFWIAFSAVTDGTLEFMIAPKDDGTDYDFALFEGFCPNDQCSEPIFCNYLPYLCTGTAKTGVADDPLTTFGVDSSESFEIHGSAIDLKAGYNYYLLIENRNEGGSICPLENPNAGFTIEFAGSAMVDKLIERPTIAPNFPKDTSAILSVCEGDILEFSVTQVPNASTYDWISKSISDATFTYNAVGDSVSVQFGQLSGQICMEMICPIQSLICWEVDVDIIPELEAINDTNTACDAVDLNTRFTDNKGVVDATVVYYETAEDAAAQTNPLNSNKVGVSGNYWARKTTPNGCFDIVQMTILTENIELTPIDTVRVCGTTIFDFRNMDIQSANGNTGNLKFLFFKNEADAVNRTSEILPPFANGNGQYWVRAEKRMPEGPCFDIQPFEFILETQPELAPIDTLKFCNSSCFKLLDIPLQELNGQAISKFKLSFYTTEAAANEGGIMDTFVGQEICESGTYWVRASSSETCFDVQAIPVIAFDAPDIDDVTLDIDCTFGCVDLSTQVFTDKNGLSQSDLTYSYFATEAAANNPAATAVSDLNICEPTELWLRITYLNGCFDVAKITIEGIELARATISGDALICEGEVAALNIDLEGNAPFTIVYTDGLNNVEVTAQTNSLQEAISPDTTTIYTLISVKDGNGCVGIVGGSQTIRVEKGVEILNLSRDCNATATEYTIIIELTGGDPASYQVNGISGTLTGNIFTSDPISSGDSYGYTISDASGCAALVQAPVSFACECNSAVGEMDRIPIGVCELQPAIGYYLGGERLDKEDIIVYVLHDSPDTTLGNVIASSNMSIFVFDENRMEYGDIYYMSAVVTKADFAGNPVLSVTDNPCLRTSFGAPVTFHPIPEISVSLADDTTCLGEPVAVTFHIDGVGPYNVNFYDGEKITSLMGIDSGHVEFVNPPFTSNIFVQTVTQNGVSDCRRDNMNFNMNQLTVLNPPKIENFEFLCNKEATNLVISFDITGGRPGTYEVTGIQGNIINGRFVSDSIGTNTPYFIEVRDINNCSPIILQGTAICLCTPDILVAIEVVKPINCRGDKDAILNVEPINGQAPFTYFWSTGETTTTISNISAGTTLVTMTDGNGCEIIDSILIEDPRSITADHNIKQVSCYGKKDGGILIVNVEGGTGDYTFSIDNGPFQIRNVVENLSAGVYDIALKDEHGCLWSDQATVTEPSELDITLGGNVILNLGESTQLIPQINQEIISIAWESEDPTTCLDCEELDIMPTKSTRYKVIVTTESGCVASDQVLVQVENNRRIFVPNTFSPNGDGTNDVLAPYGSPEVQDISMFRVYNRWGELMYERKDMPTEAGGGAGWDGQDKNGRKSPVGVYLYFLEVNYLDGGADIITGDVSLVR